MLQNACCAYRTESTFSSPGGFALPINKCFVFSLHPGIFKNSSNSSTRRLQQDHPLLPSWKTGAPGWCTHVSSSRALDPVYVTPQVFRRHVALAGISNEGSSESGSSGAGFAGVGVAMAGEIAGRSGRVVFVSAGVGAGGSSVAFLGSGAGVSSTVECLPVVHGGMARNSSKVKTRGLQHFQPAKSANCQKTSCATRAYDSKLGLSKRGQIKRIRNSSSTKVPTLLPLVEHWGARMINTVFLRVGEGLSTPLVDALVGHCVLRSGTLERVRLREERWACV